MSRLLFVIALSVSFKLTAQTYDTLAVSKSELVSLLKVFHDKKVGFVVFGDKKIGFVRTPSSALAMKFVTEFNENVPLFKDEDWPFIACQITFLSHPFLKFLPIFAHAFRK